MGAPTGDGFRVLDSFSRIVRLGEGLHRIGRLSAAAMERALAALHACAARLERRPVRELRAIATEACRQAANGSEFLARVQAETGLRLRHHLHARGGGTGAGKLRAAAGGAGAAGAAVRYRRRVDGVGLGAAGPAARPELIGYDSLPVGVVTLAERFGRCGVRRRTGFEAMVDDVAAPAGGFEAVHCIGHEIRERRGAAAGDERGR